MSIQFLCATCAKPIEIDDEFAGQAVTCPYCRKVMHAPAAGGAAPGVTGGGFAAGPPAATPMGIPNYETPQVVRSNWFASAGLVCAVVLLVLMCVVFAGAAKVIKQIAPDMKVQPDQTQQLAEQAAREPMVVVGYGLMLITSIVGVVFSILGLTRRTGRRWQAIVGLIACGLMLALACLNVAAGFATMASGKGP